MTLSVDTYYLEPIKEQHAWPLCDFCVTNEERLKRFFPKTLNQNSTPELSNQFASLKAKLFNANEEFLFVLKENENDSIFGLIYIKDLNHSIKQAELAYAIDYQLEGKGLMTKIVKTISTWAFEELQLKTLQIIAHKINMGSIRVAEKCGYTWQRVLHNEYTPPNEKALDMELYELYA